MLNLNQVSLPSKWTRGLLAGLGLTLFSLANSLFLTAILGAAGDTPGMKAFSAVNVGLFVLFAAECIGLLAVIAVRLELQRPAVETNG